MRCFLLLLVTISTFSTLTGAQQSWTTVKEWDSGPSNNRLDIVVLGDGYRSQDLPLFRNHVTSMINALMSTPPMNRYKHLVNVWRVEVESNDAGADHPITCFSPPVTVDTELNSQYCTGGVQRCLTASSSLALQTALVNVPDYDEVIVVVNDSVYGGCASSIATYAGGNSSGLQVAIHEMGHSVHGLADEYWTSGTTYVGGELSQENVTIQDSGQIASSGTKWSHWLNVEGVSAFQGGRYYEFGIYRPKSQCKMKSNGPDFCPVCREVHLETCWSHVSSFDSVSPAPGTYPTGTTILNEVFPAMGTGVLTTEWVVDGTLTFTGTQSASGSLTTATFDTSTAGLSSGSHAVTLHVYDNTTWYRRNAQLEPMSPVTWLLTDTHADYEMTSLSVDTIPTGAGDLFQVTDTVENNGVTAGNPIRVGYYFSASTSFNTGNLFLGSRIVPGLPVGGASSASTHVRLPATGAGQYGFVGAIVDDLNQSLETNETNNIFSTSSLITLDTTQTLVPNQFLLPYGQADTVHFTLSAGSSHAGEEYHLFPSLSPFGPSTDFGSFVGTAPFTFDPLAILVGTQNPGMQAYFQNFAGILDANGVAQATFYHPPLPPAAATFIRFWYFTYDPMTNLVPRFSNPADLLLF